MGKKRKKPETFEAGLERLEQIAADLEAGELKLEEAIQKYEHGVKLYGNCHEILTRAEKKVQMLTRDADGKLKPVPFDDEPAEPADADVPTIILPKNWTGD
ncbi:MAG: exodeoxyribonuclease VII small subunit [Planctomycetes bacterium]|nr:exodeoxyribonuclease VII small subunit [Planctomycetota bacterium]